MNGWFAVDPIGDLPAALRAASCLAMTASRSLASLACWALSSCCLACCVGLLLLDLGGLGLGLLLEGEHLGPVLGGRLSLATSASATFCVGLGLQLGDLLAGRGLARLAVAVDGDDLVDSRSAWVWVRSATCGELGLLDEVGRARGVEDRRHRRRRQVALVGVAGHPADRDVQVLGALACRRRSGRRSASPGPVAASRRWAISRASRLELGELVLGGLELGLGHRGPAPGALQVGVAPARARRWCPRSRRSREASASLVAFSSRGDLGALVVVAGRPGSGSRRRA